MSSEHNVTVLICSKCQSACRSDSRFCGNCGAGLQPGATPVMEPPATRMFCEKCLAETTSESPGDCMMTAGMGGTYLSSGRWSNKTKDLCPTCGSIVQIKWSVRPLSMRATPEGTYRMLYLKKGIAGITADRYVGRRLIQDPIHAPLILRI
jgi:hypothetical protein